MNEEKKNPENNKVIDTTVYWFGNRCTQLI